MYIYKKEKRPPHETKKSLVMEQLGTEDELPNLEKDDGQRILTAPFPTIKEKIKTLPEIIVLDENKTVCSICIEYFAVGSTAKLLPCRHFFHGECVATWLRSQRRCPICRQKVPCFSLFNWTGQRLHSPYKKLLR